MIMDIQHLLCWEMLITAKNTGAPALWFNFCCWIWWDTKPLCWLSSKVLASESVESVGILVCPAAGTQPCERTELCRFRLCIPWPCGICHARSERPGEALFLGCAGWFCGWVQKEKIGRVYLTWHCTLKVADISSNIFKPILAGQVLSACTWVSPWHSPLQPPDGFHLLCVCVWNFREFIFCDPFLESAVAIALFEM